MYESLNFWAFSKSINWETLPFFLVELGKGNLLIVCSIVQGGHIFENTVSESASYHDEKFHTLSSVTGFSANIVKIL